MLIKQGYKPNKSAGKQSYANAAKDVQNKKTGKFDSAKLKKLALKRGPMDRSL